MISGGCLKCCYCLHLCTRISLHFKINQLSRRKKLGGDKCVIFWYATLSIFKGTHNIANLNDIFRKIKMKHFIDV